MKDFPSAGAHGTRNTFLLVVQNLSEYPFSE